MRIRGQIDGDYEGWTGDTIVKLMNGLAWQQATYHYHYHYAFMPAVEVALVNGQTVMRVDCPCLYHVAQSVERLAKRRLTLPRILAQLRQVRRDQRTLIIGNIGRVGLARRGQASSSRLHSAQVHSSLKIDRRCYLNEEEPAELAAGPINY